MEQLLKAAIDTSSETILFRKSHLEKLNVCKNILSVIIRQFQKESGLSAREVKQTNPHLLECLEDSEPLHI